MADVNTFRDFPTRSVIFTERERVLEARRALVQELQQSVNVLQLENDSREEHLRHERLRYAQRKSLQDEKLSTKEAQIRTQHERLQQFVSEEERLQGALQRCEESIQAATGELERRKELEIKVHEIKDRLTQMKLRLEESEGNLIKLESRMERQAIITEKRHGMVVDQVPTISLPRLGDNERGLSVEDMAGDSILLVDETL
ncbi:unnamed protein product [Phytomonas sp. Hart1]|nr:unnamed protein product [Phytomonas sp. Hart1]|eukprot:CCW65978.1 unnamed protein product [Phytomonas sp. isolate Hart1]